MEKKIIDYCTTTQPTEEMIEVLRSEFAEGNLLFEDIVDRGEWTEAFIGCLCAKRLTSSEKRRFMECMKPFVHDDFVTKLFVFAGIAAVLLLV